MNHFAKHRLALALSAISLASAESFAQSASGSEGERLVIDEIIVTAQRRSQSIQDVANSIDAITGSELDALNKTNLEDYITGVGGVGLTRSGSGSIKIGMRGVSAIAQDDYAFAGTVSTAGLYLDDVPIQGAGAVPDLNIYDLQRVEVLKGPQGTLYGEGAMGGAIKMVLNKPDLSEFQAKAEATALDTKNADIGYRVRGAVNLPIIEDRLAARIVGATDEKPGYIDNIATGEDGVNDTETWSLRASVLAQVTDRFSAELLVLHDELDMDALGNEKIALGDLQTDLLEDEYNNVETDIYALTLKYSFDFAEFTSVSSWHQQQRSISQRLPLAIDETILPAFGFPPFGFSANETLEAFDDVETFTQEIRLVSSGDNTLDWTVGAFYRDRDRDVCTFYDSPAALPFNDFVNAIGLGFFAFPQSNFDCAIQPTTGVDILNRTASEGFEQYAVYGEVNYELSETIELTAGVRYFDEEVTFTDKQDGFGFLSFFTAPEVSSTTSDDDTLFKVGVSWTPNEDQLYYFNIAEGFRSGGSNLQAVVTTDPERYRSFQSDDLINYELGAKTTWADGRLTLNGAIYYSDWRDVQSQVFVPAITTALVGVLTSGGDAEVTGVEVQLNYLANENFSMGFSVTAQEAEFTDPTLESNIVPGSQLPNAPDLTASAFAQYQVPTTLGEFVARVEYLHVDEQRTVVEPVFIASPPYDDSTTILPSYDLLNLTLGLRTDNWYVTAFARNLTDERYRLDYGYSTAFIFGSNPDITAVGAPRTLGLTVGVNF